METRCAIATDPVMLELKATQALNIWRLALVETVRRDAPDLSARQLALLLTVYLTPPPHTVRGLADSLNVSKPAITRALDRLGTLGYLRRKTDEADRRNVLVQRTVRGSVYLRDFADLVIASATAPTETGAD
ncbi:MAG: MarR family transcriptional regulator [Alphaproteobacteria bacterium]|nr:MarR family transcriptional regulator [Alphaproteobacteria bacterium]